MGIAREHGAVRQRVSEVAENAAAGDRRELHKLRAQQQVRAVALPVLLTVQRHGGREPAQQVCG